MNEPELFSVPEVKSPRMRWIAKHALVTQHHPEVTVGDECAETGAELYPWTAKQSSCCYPKNVAQGGATEDDALASWARQNGVRMWFEEGL